MTDITAVVSDEYSLYALNAQVLGQTQQPSWYAAPFQAAGFVPDATDTATNVVGDSDELDATEYDAVVRPVITLDGYPATTNPITNSQAIVTITALVAITFWGVSIYATNVIEDANGLLMGSGKLPAPGKVLDIGDKVELIVSFGAGDMNA